MICRIQIQRIRSKEPDLTDPDHDLSDLMKRWIREIRGRFHEASFVFSFLNVKEGGFLTFGKASLKSCFTKPPFFHLTKDFP